MAERAAGAGAKAAAEAARARTEAATFILCSSIQRAAKLWRNKGTCDRQGATRSCRSGRSRQASKPREETQRCQVSQQRYPLAKASPFSYFKALIFILQHRYFFSRSFLPLRLQRQKRKITGLAHVASSTQAGAASMTSAVPSPLLFLVDQIALSSRPAAITYRYIVSLTSSKPTIDPK